MRFQYLKRYKLNLREFLVIFCIAMILFGLTRHIWKGFFQTQFGFMYLHGIIVDQDYDKAKDWFEKSAEAGSPIGQNELGILFLHGISVKQDYKVAMELFEKSAKQGHASAVNNLAWMYNNGKGVEQNFSNQQKAFFLYQQVADTGNPTGQFNLGWMYQEGIGVTKDLELAEYWYQKSANQGYDSAINALNELN